MKTIKILSFFSLLGLLFSCENDDPIVLEPVASVRVNNLHAPQIGGQGQGAISGDFTLFDLDSGSATTDSEAWDIGFRGTTIIINGGTSFGTQDEPIRTGNASAYLAFGGLSSVAEVDELQLQQDTENGYVIPTGGGNGWYNYTPFPLNLITPITGHVIVLKTTENRYVKLEIVSYYKDAPINPDSTVHEARYYTFNYVYQPNENIKTFE